MTHVVDATFDISYVFDASPETEWQYMQGKNTEAINAVFADVAYWQGISQTTLAHAQTLQQHEIPFGDELAERLKAMLATDIDDANKLAAAQLAIVEASVLAMGYGGLTVEPKLIEAAANKVGLTMESVRLALVPSDWKLLDIANLKGRDLSKDEQMEYRSNVRRALIRCGVAPHFNRFMIRYYEIDPTTVAKAGLSAITRCLSLST